MWIRAMLLCRTLMVEVLDNSRVKHDQFNLQFNSYQIFMRCIYFEVMSG